MFGLCLVGEGGEQQSLSSVDGFLIEGDMHELVAGLENLLRGVCYMAEGMKPAS